MNWWIVNGKEFCHLCDKPVDRTNPDTHFGLSGAPVHKTCAERAMLTKGTIEK